ncbi:hypothetical protein [Synechococcus sp. CS-1332]|uniref:hypothetical protein n=1 Tax=Synechococcus sp. CS-1332 TaxID=2847972 RepID=UPI00223B7162|nr:hypothetical protein [Synechococcus sp. CS-1332]MCT0207819.1 hypothetical protein [Synechococcus sp. CS-1332]
MGLAHCPLCMGLAALCVVRCSAHALLLWRLWPGSTGQSWTRPVAPLSEVPC